MQQAERRSLDHNHSAYATQLMKIIPYTVQIMIYLYTPYRS